MQRLFILALLNFGLVGLFFLQVFSVFADGINPACPAIYGAACPAGQLFLDKKVQHPKTGEFVDLIGSNNITFAASQEVNFKIEIKNTGSATLNNIAASDILPDFVNFVAGSGNFDKNNKTLNWQIDNLNPGESRFFQIKTQVKPQNELSGFDIACITNFAQSKKDQQIAQDSALFCIQNPVQKVAPVKALPKTGAPPVIWLLMGLLPLGLFVRRFGKISGIKSGSPLFDWQKREFLKK